MSLSRCVSLFLTLGRCVLDAVSLSLCGSVAVSPVVTQPRVVVAQAADVDALLLLGNQEQPGSSRYSKYYLFLKALAAVKAEAGVAFYADGWSVPLTYVGKTYQTLADRLIGHKSSGQLTYLVEKNLVRAGRTCVVNRYVHSVPREQRPAPSAPALAACFVVARRRHGRSVNAWDEWRTQGYGGRARNHQDDRGGERLDREGGFARV